MSKASRMRGRRHVLREISDKSREYRDIIPRRFHRISFGGGQKEEWRSRVSDLDRDVWTFKDFYPVDVRELQATAPIKSARWYAKESNSHVSSTRISGEIRSSISLDIPSIRRNCPWIETRAWDYNFKTLFPPVIPPSRLSKWHFGSILARVRLKYTKHSKRW